MESKVRRVGRASRKRSKAASVPLSSTDSGRAAEKHLVGSSDVAQAGGGRGRTRPINTHSLSAGSYGGDALNNAPSSEGAHEPRGFHRKA